MHCSRASEERMVLYALLPEVLAVIALIKVELHSVLVVALSRREKKCFFPTLPKLRVVDASWLAVLGP